MQSIREQSLKGVAWNGVGRFATLGIQFVVSIILARLLTPKDFGVIGLLTFFFAFANTFVDSGFTGALIQKKDLKDIDSSTVFLFNMVAGVTMYIIIYISAPWIAIFFDIPILINVTRISGLNVLIGALTAVQTALYSKKVDFKTTSIASVIASAISGIVAISMAYCDFGIWALVYQQLLFSLLKSIFLWCYSEWKPKLEFSWYSFREMFSYGSKLLGASILGTIYNHGEKLAIGKFYTPQELGLYTNGTHLASQGSTTITGILSTVTFPVLSKIQDDNSHLLEVYKKYIQISSIIIFFFMIEIAALAKPITLFLFGEKWIGSVIFLQIICFDFMFGHISAINLNLFSVKGRSDIVLKLEVVKRIISISILLLSIPFGIVSICMSRVVYCHIAIFINSFYTGKLFKYGYISQWKDFGKFFIFSFISGIPSFLISLTNIPNIAQLTSGFIISSMIYFFLLKATHNYIFENYIYNEFRKKIIK